VGVLTVVALALKVFSPFRAPRASRFAFSSATLPGAMIPSSDNLASPFEGGGSGFLPPFKLVVLLLLNGDSLSSNFRCPGVGDHPLFDDLRAEDEFRPIIDPSNDCFFTGVRAPPDDDAISGGPRQGKCFQLV
jgi:hypothetical protein